MGIKERKERERERRRQQIMVAAKRVFSQKGLDKTTMEDIAGEAELSSGTLYNYFKNKEELYASLSVRLLNYLLILVEPINATPDSPDKQVEALRQALCDLYEFDPLILRNLPRLVSGETLKHLNAELLEQIQTLSRKALSEMGKVFEKGARQGRYLETDPAVLSNIIWSFFSGIVQWEESLSIINGNEKRLKQTFEEAFDIFFRGIRADAFPQVPKIAGRKKTSGAGASSSGLKAMEVSRTAPEPSQGRGESVLRTGKAA